MLLFVTLTVACRDDSNETSNDSLRVAATFSATPRPTSTPFPTARPVAQPLSATTPPRPENLRIVKSGFGQARDNVDVGWGMLIENPNATHTALDSYYEIAFLDALGNQIDTDSGTVDVIYPGEQLVVGSRFGMLDPRPIERIDVTLKPGRFSTGIQTLPLATSGARYVDSGLSPVVTAVISNPHDAILDGLWVGAIAYDARGEIIGGGYGGLQALGARNRAGVVVQVTTAGVPDRVEVSARATGRTHPRMPNPATDPVVTYMDVADDPDGLLDGWAAVLENPSPDQALLDTWYHATFYDIHGQVVGSSSGNVAVILPDMTTAIGSFGNGAIAGTTATSMDVSFYVNEVREVDLRPDFTVTGVHAVTETLSTRISGTVNSALPFDLRVLQAVALAFDADGNLISAGASLFGPVESSGSTEVDVRLPIHQPPARSEMYIQLGVIPELGP